MCIYTFQKLKFENGNLKKVKKDFHTQLSKDLLKEQADVYEEKIDNMKSEISQLKLEIDKFKKLHNYDPQKELQLKNQDTSKNAS